MDEILWFVRRFAGELLIDIGQRLVNGERGWNFSRVIFANRNHPKTKVYNNVSTHSRIDSDMVDDWVTW